MRGAGTADHTGDSNHKHAASIDPTVEREELRRTMTTCAVSGVPLRFGQETIVACPYGRLYHKEAAVEALIKRKKDDQDTIGAHVRGLKDLKEVRFHLVKAETTTSSGDKNNTDNNSNDTLVPACPIRGSELNGLIPAVAIIPGGSSVNVVSERALKEMKDDVLQEYGPMKKLLKLAPTAVQLKEIQQERKHDKKSQDKKTSKKRKTDADTLSSGPSLGDEIRAKVATKVRKSEALSSLFATSGGGSTEQSK